MQFSDEYIVVKGDISLKCDNNANKRNKNLAFNNNASFIYCISKINGIKIDNAEDLDVVMPMYNLLEYNKNYRKTTSSLWNYYRDEPRNQLCSNSESSKHRLSIVGKIPEVNVSLTNAKVLISRKYFSNFWMALSIPLINCEVELILTCSKNCLLADMTRHTVANSAIVASSGATFKIKDKNPYVQVVTLSKENDTKLLEQLKTGFKRTIKWNKYRSQMIVQSQNNNLNYLIDPAFTNVNRLFVLSFARTNASDKRDSFSDYYIPNIEIKDFDVLIDGKSFFHLLEKMKKKPMNKLWT